MSPSPAREAPHTRRPAKRPAKAAASAAFAKRPRRDDAMQAQDLGAAWGQRRARTRRPVLAAAPLPMDQQAGLLAPLALRGPRLEQPPEVARADAASPRPDDMDEDDFSLQDPGTPTAGDLAYFAAEPFGPGHVGPSDPANTLALIDEDFDWLAQLLSGQ